MYISKIIRNIMMLGAVYAGNAALVIVIVAYISRTIGVEGWGKVVYIQMIVNYFIWFANWGFYLNTTKKLSNNRNDSNEINRIFCTSFLSQLLLTLISLLLMILLVFTFTSYTNQLDTYLIASGLLIGNFLQPLWFFNGMEMVKESAAIQFFNKLLSLPPIFLMIHGPSDIPKYFMINVSISILVGIFCLFWIKSKYKIKFKLIPALELINEIKEGAHLFFSVVWANLYASVIPMILGTVSGTASLGYYSLADRVRSAMLQLIHPITHVLFPRICFLFSTDAREADKLLKESGFLILLLSLVSTIIVFFFAKPIILTISGPNFYPSIRLLEVLVLTIPVMTASEFLMYQFLIPTGRYELQNKSRLYSFLLSVFLAYPAIVYAGNLGASWINLILEIIIVVIIISGIKNKPFSIFKGKIKII